MGKEKKLTQCEKIIRHLQDYGSITQVDALREYGIMRLASRVSNINNDTKDRYGGVRIGKVNEKGKNRYGEKIFYARYHLVEKGK